MDWDMNKRKRMDTGELRELWTWVMSWKFFSSRVTKNHEMKDMFMWSFSFDKMPKLIDCVSPWCRLHGCWLLTLQGFDKYLHFFFYQISTYDICNRQTTPKSCTREKVRNYFFSLYYENTASLTPYRIYIFYNWLIRNRE